MILLVRRRNGKIMISPKPRIARVVPPQASIDLLIEAMKDQEAVNLIKKSFEEDGKKGKLLPNTVNQFSDKQLLAFPIEILVQVTPNDIAGKYTDEELTSLKDMRFKHGGKAYLNQLTPEDLKNFSKAEMNKFLATGDRPDETLPKK